MKCPKCNYEHAELLYGGERGEAGPFIYCSNCDYCEEDEINMPSYTLAQAFSEFPMLVRYTILPHAKDLPLPAYQSEYAAGLDLRAAVDEKHGMLILPHEWGVIPTGLCLSIPKGFEGQIRPRSGLAMNYAVTVLNSPGTIDADYRGEIKVILINHNPDLPFRVERGLRIAQIVFAPVQTVTLQAAIALDETTRGEGGFGSTG